MSDDEMRATLREMADVRGEIACTGNTRDLLFEADERGLAKAIPGKFKSVVPGQLNSMYRVIGA
jgi:hypothetical protein